MLYLLSYTSDLQRIYPVKSYVNLINNEDQSMRLTSQIEDNQYLPSIFIANSKNIPFSFNLGDCYDLATLRAVKLWVVGNSYVQTIVPFVPDSDNFNLLFEQTRQNPLIQSIEYTGEKIQAYHLRNL